MKLVKYVVNYFKRRQLKYRLKNNYYLNNK
jgi:hypothetical protein